MFHRWYMDLERKLDLHWFVYRLPEKGHPHGTHVRIDCRNSPGYIRRRSHRYSECTDHCYRMDYWRTDLLKNITFSYVSMSTLSVRYSPSSHRGPLNGETQTQVKPPMPLGTQRPPFRHGFCAQTSPRIRENIRLYNCRALPQAMPTRFTSWTAVAGGTLTGVPSAARRSTRASVHARIALTCIADLASRSRVSRRTNTSEASIVSHAATTIRARLRSARVTFMQQ